MEEAIRAVPPSYREASYALGASRWSTITWVILPAARAGIITGVILGIGRIIGDTAIVWLCLGGSMTMGGTQPWWAAPALAVHPHSIRAARSLPMSISTRPPARATLRARHSEPDWSLILIILVLNAIVEYLGRFSKIQEDR